MCLKINLVDEEFQIVDKKGLTKHKDLTNAFQESAKVGEVINEWQDLDSYLIFRLVSTIT